jgi:prepilin-type N-terminal cleavage/methylation domain-containing protein
MPNTRMSKQVDGVRDQLARGFTLVEVAVVLLIVAVLIGMAARTTRGLQEAAMRRSTEATIAGVQAALRNFVLQARRLPCPADGGLPSSDPMAGREQRAAGACTGAQIRGVVPWVSLGLTENDVVDAYEGRLTYRVGADLVADNALFMSACDAAGAYAAVVGAPGRCNPACVDGTVAVPQLCTSPKNVLVGRGLRVQTSAGLAVADPAADPPTGAAYALWSHGVNRGGSYGRSGDAQAAVGDLTAAEINNAGGGALAAYYVLDAADDRLVYITILGLAQQAQLGPRPHRPPGVS